LIVSRINLQQQQQQQQQHFNKQASIDISHPDHDNTSQQQQQQQHQQRDFLPFKPPLVPILPTFLNGHYFKKLGCFHLR
jgi:hypothetical protein